MQDSGSTASSDEDGVIRTLHVFKTYGEAYRYVGRRRWVDGVAILYSPMEARYENGDTEYFRAIEKPEDFGRVAGFSVCRVALHSELFSEEIKARLRSLVRCNHDNCARRRQRLGNGGVDQFFAGFEPGQPDSGSSVRSGETTTGSDG